MIKFTRTLYSMRSICFALLFAMVQISCSQIKTRTELTKSEKIAELVGLYSDYEGFNGSVLVAHKGEVIYKKGFGLANMQWDVPNKTDTKFQIASVTKSFTALLIMQLVAENELDLHTPISKYLPDYPKENSDQITIHQLLTHSSGLNNDLNDEKKYNIPKDMVNQFSNSPLKFNPGERFEYSNSGYTLLGYIIETITGKSYEEVLQDNIFKPLNMNNSGYYRYRPLIKNMASGHYKSFGEYYNHTGTDESTAYAAGAIYSTVEDMFLWDQALYEETLLSKKYLDIIFTKHIKDPGYGGHYGYGWELKKKPIGNSDKQIETIGHSGSIDGFCALFTRIPSSHSSIIFLNNTSRAYLNTMTTAITGILNDVAYDFPKKPLAKFMAKVIEKDGVMKGIQFYKKHKDDSDYYTSEQELIVAGYRLLHAGNAKDAADVFKLSIDVFPERDNPYDSYAEALMTLGQNEEAIINYKKSLELNPKNNNAVKMLDKLGVDGSASNDILKADSTWGKEIFKMPLHFANDIKLRGIEDARFPKGWLKEEHPEFWSYAFGWNVNLNDTLTVELLEDYMRKYYDGLSKDVNKEKNRVLPKTVAKFSKNDDTSFRGQVSIHDSFVTKKTLQLNISVIQQVCQQKDKSILLFRISPKPFNHSIWEQLNAIKIREYLCD